MYSSEDRVKQIASLPDLPGVTVGIRITRFLERLPFTSAPRCLYDLYYTISLSCPYYGSISYYWCITQIRARTRNESKQDY